MQKYAVKLFVNMIKKIARVLHVLFGALELVLWSGG